jgi:hypothetical protein
MFLDRIPETVNPLYPNKFRLDFARLPEISYFCQMVTIPGISIGESLQPTPFVDLYLAGDKMVYDYLTVTFMVDENLLGWNSLYLWLRGLTFPTDFAEYRTLNKLNKFNAAQATKKPQYSDGTLTILKASNVSNLMFKFYDCFPTSLGAIPLSTMDSPDNIVTCDVTIRYSYFDLVSA